VLVADFVVLRPPAYELTLSVATTNPVSLRVRVYRLRRWLRPLVEEVLDPLVAG
jgi:hypothetical protein